MLLYLNKGEEMNTSALNSEFRRLLDRTSRVAAARIASMAEESEGVEHKYNPVGYVLSVGKDAEDQKLNKRSEMIQNRIARTKKLYRTHVDS